MGNSGQPSPTALTSAAARAADLIVDHEPLIFSDTLAALFLADRADELLSYHRSHGSHPVLAGARATVTARSRYTEAPAPPGRPLPRLPPCRAGTGRVVGSPRAWQAR